MSIAYDFESIKNRILQELSGKSEWSNFLDQGAIVHLVESITQEMAYEMQGKEYYTMENWWSLARNKSSLLAEALSLNYVVPRKKGANGSVILSTSSTFNAPYATDLSIPKYFQVSNGSIVCSVVEDNILLSTENFKEVIVKQGEAKSITFTSVGNTFEIYSITDAGVDNDLFDLSVDGVPWTAIDNIFNATEDQLVYQIYTDPSLTKVILRFGNGIFGRRLLGGQTVVFNYLSTLGSTGNIATTNNVIVVEDQLQNQSGNAVPLYCSNLEPIIGGVDYPSIEEIRNRGPQIVQSGDRAIGVNDYVVILSENPSLSKINVWGAKEYLEDNNLDMWSHIPTEENVVHIAALGASPTYTSIYSNTNIKDSILTLLRPICDPTTIISFEEVEKVPLVFTINAVARNTSYSASSLSALIVTALQTSYGIQTMNFYDSLYYSDLMSLIDGITGIRNHLSSVSSYKVFSFSEIGTVSRASVTLPLTPLNPSSLKVYVKDITSDPNASYALCAEGTADGKFTSVGSFTVNGNININSGLASFIISSPSYSGKLTENLSLKIEYSASTLDLITANRRNILNYDSSIITIRYP